MAPTPTRGEPIPDEAIYAAYDDYLRQRPHTPPRAVFRDVVRELLTEQRATDYAAAADAAIESGFAAQAAAQAAIAGAFTEDGPVPLAVIGYLDQAAQEVVAEVVMDGVVVSTIRQGYHQLREYRDLIAASYQYARGPEGTAVPAALPAREGAAPNLEPHYAGYHIPTVEIPRNEAVDNFDCGDTCACAAGPPTEGYFRKRAPAVFARQIEHTAFHEGQMYDPGAWAVVESVADGTPPTLYHPGPFATLFEYARGPEGGVVPATLPAREGAPPNLEPHYAGEAGDADTRACATAPPTEGHFRERGAIVHAFRAQAGVRTPGGEYVDARRWVVTRGDGATESYSHEHFGQRFEYVGD